MKKRYRLLFANHAEHSKGNDYGLVKETPMYVYLQQKNMPHVFRVNKKYLTIKGIKEGEDGYRWDCPRARSLKEL